MHKHLTICGAFGGINMGDEAIAQTMQAQVAAAFPQAKITLLCMVRGETLNSRDYISTMPGAIARDNLRAVFKALRNGPLIIGGGQMLNGGGRPKGLILLWLFTLIAAIFRQPIALIGVGARNITANGMSRWLIRGIAGRARLIRVRDVQTKEALIASGVPTAKIELTADVVFSGPVKALVLASQTRTQICFAVHHSPHASHSNAKTYAVMMQQVMAAYPSAVPRIVCHDNRQAYDINFARDVASAFDGTCDVLVPDQLQEVVDAYANATLIVSSRMHPLIIGLIAGADVLPLAGSEKVADLVACYHEAPPMAIDAATAPFPVISGVPYDLWVASVTNFDRLSVIMGQSA